MLNKAYTKTGRSCRVTFKLQPEINARTVNLCGEFNDWDFVAHPMRRLKNGGFTLILSLHPGRQYRFKYLLDGDRWENDSAADGYVPNAFGSYDSIVNV
jgi:1,4-alpha-glucan branching enzyme